MNHELAAPFGEPIIRKVAIAGWIRLAGLVVYCRTTTLPSWCSQEFLLAQEDMEGSVQVADPPTWQNASDKCGTRLWMEDCIHGPSVVTRNAFIHFYFNCYATLNKLKGPNRYPSKKTLCDASAKVGCRSIERTNKQGASGGKDWTA